MIRKLVRRSEAKQSNDERTFFFLFFRIVVNCNWYSKIVWYKKTKGCRLFTYFSPNGSPDEGAGNVEQLSEGSQFLHRDFAFQLWEWHKCIIVVLGWPAFRFEQTKTTEREIYFYKYNFFCTACFFFFKHKTTLMWNVEVTQERYWSPWVTISSASTDTRRTSWFVVSLRNFIILSVYLRRD